MWFNQYITFFFTEHFKSIPICFEVLRGLCWRLEASLQWITPKDTWKLICFGHHFVRSDCWIGSEKGVLHFNFTEIGCPATVPGDLKFITDSLPLFGLNETFLIAKSEASMMWGDAMPHKMNKFTKKFSSSLMKKHHRLCLKKKILCLTASVCLFAIDKCNSCLFETCV